MQAKLSNIIENVESVIDGDGIYIVAIDGRCASGKTTLAEKLLSRFDCNVFHMDDFFLRPEQRTEERLSKAGENVDHERFALEVLAKLAKGESVTYRRYDCHTQSLCEAVTLPIKKINFVEGVYSMHPELVDYYNLKIFMDVESDVQKGRLEKRNSAEMVDRFYKEWIPMEEKYFNELKIREKADFIYEIEE